jgi:ERCC4-type nuclease
MEIQDLILSIKQDISNLNRQIAQLQQVYIYRFLYLIV